jgi:hypothetical protein
VEETLPLLVDVIEGKMSLVRAWVESGCERSQKAAARLNNPPINQNIENPERCP